MEKKKLLYEVSYIRPIVIFLLVVSHSFTKIQVGPNGAMNDYDLATGYLWLVRLIKGFRIETIALVAGYVFAYQSIDLKRKYEFCYENLYEVLKPIIKNNIAECFRRANNELMGVTSLDDFIKGKK